VALVAPPVHATPHRALPFSSLSSSLTISLSTAFTSAWWSD
jgi:hypothetical protein